MTLEEWLDAYNAELDRRIAILESPTTKALFDAARETQEAQIVAVLEAALEKK